MVLDLGLMTEDESHVQTGSVPAWRTGLKHEVTCSRCRTCRGTMKPGPSSAEDQMCTSAECARVSFSSTTFTPRHLPPRLLTPWTFTPQTLTLEYTRTLAPMYKYPGVIVQVNVLMSFFFLL